MTFGKESEKGIKLNTQTLKLEVVTIGENGITEQDILVHNESNKVLAQMLVELSGPEFPTAVGVIYQVPAEAYVEEFYSQRIEVRQKKDPGDLNKLLRSGHTWTVD
jgi:2-oxoglutarate ferredoxin oxidoreductase subunit beta